MTSEEYKKISGIIKEKSGIRLEPRDHKRMAHLAKERAKTLRLKPLREYIKYLKSGNDIAELDELINKITVPETYFFRDSNQYDALRHYILPKLLASKKENKISIWSAGCSTGEEAYTIAVIIAWSIPDLRLWDIKIIGTDINRISIEKAKEGVYTKNSFRGVKEELVNGYFVETTKGMKIKEPMRSLVRFETFNMKLDEGAIFPDKYRKFDIVFCRNVLIYFEKEVIRNIFNGFRNSLLPGGYLILGHSEASLAPRELFDPVRTNDTYIYQRRDGVFGNRESGIGNRSTKYQISKSQPETRNPKIGTQSTKHKAQNSYNSHYKKVLSLYFEERYTDAEVELEKLMIRHNVGVDGMLLAALIKINLGNFGNAMDYVEKIRQKDEFLPDAHFIIGLIHENENDYEQAVKAYEAALFLDGKFFLSHFRLGHLYGKTGKTEESVHAFKNALVVIKAEDDDKIRLLSGGFTRESLEDICERGIL